MKGSSCIRFGILLVLSLPSIAFSQSSSGSAQVQVKSIPYKVIQAEAKKYGAQVFEGAENQSSVHEINLDLNLDGINDKIWVAGSSAFCGSGGCSTYLVLSKNNKFVVQEYENSTYASDTDSIISYSRGSNGELIWRDKSGALKIKVMAAQAGPKFSKLVGNVETYDGAGCMLESSLPKQKPMLIGATDINYKGMVFNLNGKDELFVENKPGGPIFKNSSGVVTIKTGKPLKCEEECSKNAVEIGFKGAKGDVTKINAIQTCGS